MYIYIYMYMYIYISCIDMYILETWNWTVVRTRTVVMVMYERRKTSSAFIITFSDTTCQAVSRRALVRIFNHSTLGSKVTMVKKRYHLCSLGFRVQEGSGFRRDQGGLGVRGFYHLVDGYKMCRVYSLEFRVQGVGSGV